MSVGPLQLLLIVLIIVLLFGTKKLGNIGSDLGKAIRDFKKGMSGDEEKDKDAATAETLKAEETTAKSEAADTSGGSAGKSSNDHSGH